MRTSTAEARRHGERSGDLVIARDRVIGKAELTAETRRRGEDQKPTTKARKHGERSGDRVIKIIQTIKATLREIFDESAYDRFLEQTQAPRSVASYQAFTRERDAALLKKPRCC